MNEPPLSLDNAIEVLQRVRGMGSKRSMISEIEKLRIKATTPEIIEELGTLIGALDVPDQLGHGQIVRDPQSGNPYPTTVSLIDKCVINLKKMSSSFNLHKYSQKKDETLVNKKKKDPRGNPFRVLMGKVGKLLDHGLSRKDIVRYLEKEKVWKEEIIEKAIKIVKEYNKKKEKKRKTEAQTLPINAEEWPRSEPNYKKRSSGELLASICWLSDLSKVDGKKFSERKEVADRSGVKTMIRKIKSELLDRGMSEEALDNLLK